MSLSTVQRQQADLNTSHYCSQQGTLTLFRRSKYDAVHARNSWNFPVLRNGQVHMGLSFLAYMPLTPLTSGLRIGICWDRLGRLKPHMCEEIQCSITRKGTDPNFLCQASSVWVKFSREDEVSIASTSLVACVFLFLTSDALTRNISISQVASENKKQKNTCLCGSKFQILNHLEL